MNNIPPRPYWSGRNSFREVGLEGLVFGLGVEAGAGLVDTGEVAVAEDAGRGVVGTKGTEQGREGGLLEGRAGVGRATVGVETALVADAEAVGVVALGVGTGDILGAGGMQAAVAGDVPVIAAAVVAPGPVTGRKGFHRETAVAAGGRAVDDDEIDRSHGFPALECTALYGDGTEDGGDDGGDEAEHLLDG